MIVFPLAAAAVALVFAGLLGRQYLSRRHLFLGLWTIALLMYAGASIALFLGVLGPRWSAGEYRTYYLLGAILNVPYLALGEVYLLSSRRWVGHALLVLLLAGTALAMASVRTAPIDTGTLAADLPSGSEVFGDGSTPHRLAQYYGWSGYLVLLAGTVWSALRMRGTPSLRDRFHGTLLIATGATIVAIATGVGNYVNSFVLFSSGLLAGMVLMFAGFLRASRRPPATPA